MKHIKAFTSGILYEAFINSQNFIRPNVSLIKDNNSIMYNPYIEPNNQSSEDGFIDLGLPSGTKWANKNLGAENESETGSYFAWGGTTPATLGVKNNIPYYDGEDFTKYNNDDGLSTLELSDDAANIILGNGAHIPTQEQWVELIENTNRTWVENYNNSGLNGVICTSKVSGYANKSIFLPAAGFYGQHYDETIEYWVGGYGRYFSNKHEVWGTGYEYLQSFEFEYNNEWFNDLWYNDAEHDYHRNDTFLPIRPVKDL